MSPLLTDSQLADVVDDLGEETLFGRKEDKMLAPQSTIVPVKKLFYCVFVMF
jgi:hypothetical protein